MDKTVRDVMNFKYSHFKPHVSPALQNKIRCLCDAITPFIERWTNRPELVTSWELEPIEGNHVSGWIPHQDGGFQISCFIDTERSIYDENDPDLIFFRAFVEQGKIVMQYGFNNEAPYYREKYHTILKTLSMDEAEFMDSSIVNIVKELAE